MRKAWLVFRREYLERVRAKSFIVSTFLIPAFIYGVTVVPTQLATRKSGGLRRLAIVASDQATADAVQKKLEAPKSGNKYELTRKVSDDPKESAALKQQIESGSLDGYLWLTNDAIEKGKVEFVANSTSDFVEISELHDAINTGVVRGRLAQKGIASADVEQMLKPVDMDTVEFKGGQEKKGPGEAKFFAGFAIAMTLYFMLIFHGMAVMRSVLEEKTSRVMEVMLASVSPKELMAGKILGVGVGWPSPQVAIWVALALAAPNSSWMIAAGRKTLREMYGSVPLSLLIWLPSFILCSGFLLYSGMYAGPVGASGELRSGSCSNSVCFFVTMPSIFYLFPSIIMWMIIRQPDSTASFWLSMVPFFFANLLMHRTILAMHTPPHLADCVLSIGHSTRNDVL